MPLAMQPLLGYLSSLVLIAFLLLSLPLFRLCEALASKRSSLVTGVEHIHSLKCLPHHEQRFCLTEVNATPPGKVISLRSTTMAFLCAFQLPLCAVSPLKHTLGARKCGTGYEREQWSISSVCVSVELEMRNEYSEV